jgi:hypothetical protein
MVVVTMANMIDDMEEGSPNILNRGGRSGSWFTYNDQTDGGVQTPAPMTPCLPALIPDGGRCGSLHAQHTFGSGFTNYGVGLGFDLNHPAGPRMTYDVSMYNGIAFWARGPQDIDVLVVEQATASIGEGGTCDPTTMKCDDHYQTPVSVSAGWQQYTVAWSMLKQKNFGTAVPFNKQTVFGVQFAVNPAPAFDYWIDDVGFY